MRILLIIATLIVSQGSPSLAQQKVTVIFDTDMGSDCDDVGALALLHAYADMGQADILACAYSSGKIPYGVGVIQAINHYYGRQEIPIGAYHKSDIGDSIDKMDSRRLAEDTMTYGHNLILNTDAPELTGILRKVLADSENQKVVYITVGHTKGLYDLLKSGPDQHSPLSGAELIESKVDKWVALGALNANGDQGGKDWNFFFNGTAPYTEYLVNHFPVPVYYISAGTNVMTGASLEALSKGVIVRDAYESWLQWHDNRVLADQRPSWDLAAVYYAVLGGGSYLTNTGRGSLEFDIENGCRWVSWETKGSEQYYVIQKPGTEQDFANYLNRMIAKKPSNN